MNTQKNLAYIFLSIFLIMILLLSISLASAITAKIGNGRMVLRVQTGEVIEKYVKVINENEIDVNISISASGDLADDVIIKENSFILKPKEEKNAFFTIKANKAGTTETKINVKFSPLEGAGGAGLSSVVILIAEGEDLKENNSIFDIFNNKKDNPESDSNIAIESDSNSAINRFNLTAIMLYITSAILLVFVTLLVLTYLIKRKRESNSKLIKREDKSKSKIRKKR